jgi:hypothetical protein
VPFTFNRPSKWFAVFSRPEQLDLLAVLLIFLAVGLRAATVTQVPFLAEQDMASYRAMAVDPLAYFGNLPPHHAQRALPSLAVWLLSSLTGLSVDAAFLLVSTLGVATAHAALYALLRRLSVFALPALVTVLLAGLSQWPVLYPLRNVWQACDAWGMALSALMVLATVEGRWKRMTVLAVLSVFVRQNLLVLGGAALLHLALRNHSRLALWGLAPLLAAFGLNTLLAGGGAGQVLFNHVAGRLVSLSSLLDALFSADVPWLALPLLPLLLTRESVKAFTASWWLSLFVLATLGQALLVAHLSGIENTQRLVMPAFWILTVFAAPAIRSLCENRVMALLYASTPLTLPVSRLMWSGTAFQSWHNYRLLPALFLAALLLANLIRCRRCRIDGQGT